jgi:hypothetical protein
MNPATLASFSTVKTAPARSTVTRAAGAKTRRAAAVALSSTRPYAAVAGRIGARAGARYNLKVNYERRPNERAASAYFLFGSNRAGSTG